MTDGEFAFIAAFLKERSGLVMTKDKIYLFDTRLPPVMRKHNLAGFSALVSALQSGRDESLATDIIEAMMTNETLFFRDRHPFDALRRHVLPSLLGAALARSSLRIWSAACSTGQEPYSLAMMLLDHFPKLADRRIEIVATDIAASVLERAREGVYSCFEVQRGLPVHLLVKHFDQRGNYWQIKPELRHMVRFQSFNLLNDSSPLGTFDIILCRNVLIYFDHATKCTILDRLSRRLTPNGRLLLGAAETVLGISSAFEGINNLRGVYRRANATARLHFNSIASQHATLHR